MPRTLSVENANSYSISPELKRLDDNYMEIIRKMEKFQLLPFTSVRFAKQLKNDLLTLMEKIKAFKPSDEFEEIAILNSEGRINSSLNELKWHLNPNKVNLFTFLGLYGIEKKKIWKSGELL